MKNARPLFVLNKRYQALKRLGEGGMAEVYKAYDAALGRLVALKVLRPQYTSDETFLKRFRREANAVANLSHRNIVTVYDRGQQDDVHYIVMEYIQGKSLKEKMLETGIMPVHQAVDIAIQLSDGVAVAHRSHLVHRDIKPQNVMITRDGIVKVMDFGIARALDVPSITQSGLVWGTVHYMSPEQAKGEPALPASDVYSIGAVLYEMLAGRVPFRGESTVAVAMKHIQERPTPLSQLNPLVPPEIEAIVSRALAKSPRSRYQDASEMAHALRSYRSSAEQRTAVQEIVASHTKPAPRPRQRARVGIDFLAVILATVALISILGLIPLWLAVYEEYFVAASPALPPLVTPDNPDQQEQPTLVLNVWTPNLIGMKTADAKRMLEEMGLSIAVIEQRNDDAAPPLTILEQNPAPGEQLRRGESVGVVISKGPQFLNMPNVIGTVFDAAEPRLTELGLVVRREEVWSPQPAGEIIAQEPPPNTATLPGQVVTLTVSTGSLVSIGANIDNRITLLACDVRGDIIRPGDSVPVTIYWRPHQRIDADLSIFLHLTYDDGRVITQHDARPGTQYWEANQTIANVHTLVIPPGTPTGAYWIRTGLYYSDSQRRLPVVDGGTAQVHDDSILIKRIQVINQ